MSATNVQPPAPAVPTNGQPWQEAPGIEYVWVVARPELGNQVALWERAPEHPNGEVSIDGAAPGMVPEPVRVARTGAVNDRLHPDIAKGGKLMIVSGDTLDALQEQYAHQQDGIAARRVDALQERANRGDTAAALMIAIQNGGFSTQRAPQAEAIPEADAAEITARLMAQSRDVEIDQLKEQLSQLQEQQRLMIEASKAPADPVATDTPPAQTDKPMTAAQKKAAADAAAADGQQG